MTFQAWKMKCLNSMTFQPFYDLYEPCNKGECFSVLRIRQTVLQSCQELKLILYRPLQGLRERLRARFHGGGGTRLSIQSLIID